MKIKSFVTLSLLFALSFSIVHEYVFAFYDTHHCNVGEFVSELDSSGDHGDICDIHFEYHHVFVLPQEHIFVQETQSFLKPVIYKESYKFLANLDFMKPPIS